ncbi:DnaJ domain [Raphanus sativus]|nr:DnaJ domain [Raphanus sativus]
MRYLATQDQIKKSYREAALKHHPDKLAALVTAEETQQGKEAKKEEIESRFRAIQEAYEVLTDPTKRRIFDSTDEFDVVDVEELTPREFFKVFGPAFKGVARWSAGQRVPDLGDEKTSLKEVDKFYRFWNGFKSSRAFPDYEERRHDLEKADSRQERRRMEREKAKKTAKARQEDDRLVSKEDVVNLCMSLSIEQLQSLCDTMGNKQGVELAKVINDHEANSKEKESEKVNSKDKECEKVNSEDKESEKVNAEPSKLDNTQKKKQPWSKEEIDKLRKGIIKYPKGISRRWEVISDYIGTGRTVEEILKATKTVLLQKPDSAKAFDTFLEKRKPTVSIASPLSTREEELGETFKETVVGKSSDNNDGEASGRSSDADGWSVVQERALVQALKTFPKETSQRWERVAAAVPGKTMIQCKKKFAELKELIRSKKTGV